MAHGLHIMRMGMTDRDDGMTAIEIKVFCTLIVPHATAAATDNVDGEEGINVKEIHVVFLL